MSDLIKDNKFHSATKIAEKLSKDIAKWEDSRAGTLTTLRDIQKTIEESYHDRTIAKVSGASAAVAGSTMAIIGFGLNFATFGASLGLTIAGSIVAAGGGVTERC